MSSVASAPNCSVSRALDVVADSWTFLVLREAWFGVRRFDQFQSNLGMPRGTLDARLRHLVHEGLLRRVQSRGKLIFWVYEGRKCEAKKMPADRSILLSSAPLRRVQSRGS